MSGGAYGAVAESSGGGAAGHASPSSLSDARRLTLDSAEDDRNPPTAGNFIDFLEHGTSKDRDPELGSEPPATQQARRKLMRATLICLTFMLLEVVGGYLAGSLAIMTDAAHLLSDVAGFLISMFALYLSSRGPTARLSYGFKRAEIVGAVLSVMLIWFLTGVLLWEAVIRTQGILQGTRGAVVDGRIMTVVAVFGLVCNVVLLAVLGHDHAHLGGGGHGHSHGHGGGHEEEQEEANHGHSHGGGSVADEKEEETMLLQPPPEKALSHSHSHSHGHGHSHGSDEAASAEHSDDEHEDSHEHDAAHGALRITIPDTAALPPSRPAASPHAGAGGGHNINVSAAYAHAIGDLIQSAGVCIAGAVIWTFPGEHYPLVQLADPLCTFLFSVLVLMATYGVLKTSVNVLMEGVPDGFSAKRVAADLLDIDGVLDVHHLHIWSLTVGEPSLSVHVVVGPEQDMELALQRAQHVLRRSRISHSTVQIERAAKDVCGTDNCMGSPCDRYAIACHKSGACFDSNAAQMPTRT